MTTICSVAVMLARGHTLTAQGVFTIYALASAIQKSALEYYAYGVRYLADSWVTLKRFQYILFEVSREQESHNDFALKSSRSETGKILATEGKDFNCISYYAIYKIST